MEYAQEERERAAEQLVRRIWPHIKESYVISSFAQADWLSFDGEGTKASRFLDLQCDLNRANAALDEARKVIEFTSKLTAFTRIDSQFPQVLAAKQWLITYPPTTEAASKEN